MFALECRLAAGFFRLGDTHSPSNMLRQCPESTIDMSTAPLYKPRTIEGRGRSLTVPEG